MLFLLTTPLHAHEGYSWLSAWHLLTRAWVKGRYEHFRLFTRLPHEWSSLCWIDFGRTSVTITFPNCSSLFHLSLTHHTLDRRHRLLRFLIGLSGIPVPHAIDQPHWWEVVSSWAFRTVLMALQSTEFTAFCSRRRLCIVVVARDSWRSGRVYFIDPLSFCLLDENVNRQGPSFLFLPKHDAFFPITQSWIMSFLGDNSLVLVHLLGDEVLNYLVWPG